MQKIALKLLLLCTLLTSNYNLQAQYWPYLADEDKISSNAVSYTSLTSIDVTINSEHYSSVLHIGYTENKAARVKRLIEGEWQSVGGNITTGSTSYTYLFKDNNDNLYLNYVDESVTGSNRLCVLKYNTQTDTWNPLGNTPYVSSSSIIQTVGSAHNTAKNSSLAFDANNIPYVIFTENNASNNIVIVKKFDGNEWVNVGSSLNPNTKVTSVGIAFDNNKTTPYIVYTSGSSTGAIKLHSLINNNWSEITVPAKVNNANSGATTAVRHTNLIFDNNNVLYIAYFNSSNNNKATVIKYSLINNTWEFSKDISARDSPNISLTKSNTGNIYISFADLYTNNSGRTVARVFKKENTTNTWTELKNTKIENNEVTPIDGVDEPASFISFTVSNNGNEYISYAKNSIAIVRVFTQSTPPVPPPSVPDEIVTTPKQMEFLNRGLTAVRVNSNQVLISWRLLGTDPKNIAFNVYKNGIKLNSSPIITSTNFLDNTTTNNTYTIKEVINNEEKNETTPAQTWNNNFLKIQLDRPIGGTTPDGVVYDYSPNDVSVGDVDGDGTYELFVKWDPSNSKDNSQNGYTGNVFIDCYKLDGTKLWRIDLGKNIRAGAHYTQFMVYDFDGDGKAEMACKTADGTIDGVGNVIGNINEDYRNSTGYILTGPEFLTMFNGETGAAVSTVNFIPARGSVSSWGDNYGNRVDRFVSAVAYLDGAKPSLIIGRGYYTRLVRVAWDFVNGELKQRWIFDSNSTVNNSYAGQGNHQMSIADVDGDGKDEIINGASVINDNGTGYSNDNKGHGDALHVSDMDPSTPELESWMCHEDEPKYASQGLRLRNMKTGETIWGIETTGDIGRCMAADIDPNYPGYEVWGSTGTYSVKGQLISTNKPSQNFGIWWDGDLSRELLDNTRIDKWNASTKRADNLLSFDNVASNNTTKATPNLSADILGDWREEVILRGTDNSSLYLFTTSFETNHRIHTLMHDPQYRTAIAWQNSAYNQPPHPSFFLGTGMNTPPTPNIYIAGQNNLPITLLDFTAKPKENNVELSWTTASEKNNKEFIIERLNENKIFEDILRHNGAGTTTALTKYNLTDYSPLNGKNYYRLRQVDFDGESSSSEIRIVNFSKTNNQILISPNPVSNYIKVEFNTMDFQLNFTLINAEGKVLIKNKGELNDLNLELNKILPNLASGIYILEINDTEGKQVQKFIKK